MSNAIKPQDGPNKTGSVLFICYLNSIRSPMAEGLLKKLAGDTIFVQSCGTSKGETDQLMVAVMKERGIDMTDHEPKSLEDISDRSFDVVIAFTDDAGDAAKAAFEGQDTLVEIWPTPDPTAGSLDVRAMMNNYRAIGTMLERRLKERFLT